MRDNIIIKNMVCPRCLESVQQVFQELEIEVVSIQLGSVKTAKNINYWLNTSCILKIPFLFLILISYLFF